MNDFKLESLRGGYNDTDPPTSLSEDQCVAAVNVEFFSSMLGERRRGCTAIDLTGSGLSANQYLSFLHRHLPSADETAAELWAASVTPNTAITLARKTTVWSNPTLKDAPTNTGTNGFTISGASLHGKLFLAFKSAVDRLHVWDGSTVRRVGVATPGAAPTAANTGIGTYAGKRYHRVRFTEQSGGVTLRRSEASAVLTTTPSGTGTGLIVTCPALVNEGETHWELEASLNGVDFYRIATTVIATTTATDSTAYATGYAASGVLSDESGAYTVPISAKFVVTDDDRLIMGGSRETASLGSRISWTTVGGDPTGSGNDERVPIATNNFTDLDGAGDLTAMSAAVYGFIWAFKLAGIFKLVKSGTRTQAYNATRLTKERGALEGSMVEGIGPDGSAALYFIDQHVGPCILGSQGLQTCSFDVQVTWATANLDASIVITRALYYPASRQVHWWIATNGSNTPNLKLVLQTNLIRYKEDGGRRGFSKADGTIATATSACLFATNIDSGIARNKTLAPFIGVSLAGAAAILRCDTGITDNGTVYRGYVTTRPFAMNGIMNYFGSMAGAILAKAAVGVSIVVRIIRDFGLENKDVTAVLTPTAAESSVITQMDDFELAECYTMQFSFGDLDGSTPAGRWELNSFAMEPRKEG